MAGTWHHDAPFSSVRVPLTTADLESIERRSEDGGQLFYRLKKPPTGNLVRLRN
jgi:hypothetical protein